MRSINILKKTLVALTLTLAITGAFTTKAEAKVEKIKVTAPSGKTVRVAKGKKVKLKATAKKLKNKKVKFKSNNPKVARVTAKGIVKGIKNGKTKIVVSSKSNPKIKKTIKVVVYKKAVKKIKLNKTKVSLTSGQQFKLVAKISPKKNVSKVLSYKSSNKKVATVSKKGIIKAFAAGTAKITVKATDGSKKKATCVVTVGNEEDKTPVGIKSVKVRSAYSIDVELNKAKALTYEDFKILYKEPDEKEFKDVFDIVSLNTFDNIHYEVVIRDNKTYRYKSSLKICINNIDGVKEKEIYINKKYRDNGSVIRSYCEGRNFAFDYIGANVGEKFNYYETFLDFVCADLKSITVSEVPKGLKVLIPYDNEGVTITGTFAEKVNGYKVVITAVDVNDETFTINLYFYVGDENTTYAKGYDSVEVAYKPYKGDKDESLQGASTIFPAICVTEKDFELWDCSYLIASGLPDNMYLTRNGDIEVKDLSKPVKAGEYKINLSGTTQLGKEFAATFKLTLVDGIIVKGRMTDASGKAICNEGVYYQTEFYNGMRGRQIISYTDENGNYDIRLIPGKYSFATEIGNIYKSYNVDFIKNQTYNMKSISYRVEFKSPLFDVARKKSDITWDKYVYNHIYDTKGNDNRIVAMWNEKDDGMYHFSLYTYVKKGTYGFGEYNGSGFNDGQLSYNYDNKGTERFNVLTNTFTVKGSGDVELKLEKVE